MGGILKRVERVIKWAIFLTCAMMIVAIVVQVVARTFFSQPPIWTEEVSRMTLLYIVGLGIGASVLTGDLVNVDLALMIMPKRLRRLCNLISAALVSAFGFLLVPASWEFFQLGEIQTSPVLNISMSYSFVTMPLFAGLLGLFGLVKFFEVLKNAEDSVFVSHSKVGE